jgi:hypothetical protein
VAGFSGSIEVPELHDEPTGTVTGEIGLSPPPLGLDEEETRAVNLSSVAARLGGMPGAGERSRAPLNLPPDLSDVEAMAEAETRILDYHPELFPELTNTGAHGSDGVEAVSHGEPAGSHESPPEQLDAEVHARAATPTLRQAFYNGVMNEEPRPPAAPAMPILDSQLMAARRRTLLLASGAAVVLAVMSFVIAGAFISNGNGDGSARSAAPADAAPMAPPDAAAVPPPPIPPAAAPEKAQPTIERKRKHKKSSKKRSGKSSSDRKRRSDRKR